MKEEWINDLYEKMVDYKKPAPQCLWENIEAAINKDSKKTPFSKKFVLWCIGASGIAAMITIVVAIGNLPLASSVEYTSCVKANEEDMMSHDVGKTANCTGIHAHMVDKNICHTISFVDGLKDEEYGDIIHTSKNNAANTCSSQKGTDDEETTENTIVKNDQHKSNRPSKNRNGYLRKSICHTPFGKKLSVSLSASNLSKISDKRNGYAELVTVSGPPSTETDHPMAEILAKNQEEDVYTEADHKQPIRIGFTLQYPISDKLSVESGLTFSFHSSQITSGSQRHYCETEQSLYYLGIPLHLNYQLVNEGRCLFYISGGGMIEKCITGKSKTHYIIDNETSFTEHKRTIVKPLQYSLNTSVGFQVSIFPQLSIYLEPGISYYFDNGSPIETIYKKKPLNFNLETGLRMEL